MLETLRFCIRSPHVKGMADDVCYEVYEGANETTISACCISPSPKAWQLGNTQVISQ